MVAAIAALSLTQAPPIPCGGLERRYPPLIAFELARSVTDLRAIFGAAPSACRATITAALDRVNVADVAAFIPAYTLFLCAWFAARRSRAPSLARGAIALSVFAGCSDLVENMCLFSLSARPDEASWALSLLPWATASKWLGLAVVSGLAGLLLARGSRAERIVAWMHAPALLVTSASIAIPSRYGFMIMQGITLSWVVMLALAAVDLWRTPRRRTNGAE